MSERSVNLLLRFLGAVIVLSLPFSCAPIVQSPARPTMPSPTLSTSQYPSHEPKVRFRIATTTSLYDTGLWYYLEPMFEQQAGVEMDVIYAGTGMALEYGRRGDVDAVTVHDRAAEDEFIDEGYGINRRYFAYNFFLIAGPSSDPAGIRGLGAVEAFRKIYDCGLKNTGKVKFVSRGDNSGTHSKEKSIWSEAGFKYDDVRNSGKWYIEAGKGMGPCLLMASEMGAYVLTDISTFLAYTKKTSLKIDILVEKDPLLLNVYAAIAVNPAKVRTAKTDIANKFINWLISAEVQNIIATYGKAEYGSPFFFPIGNCTLEGCPTPEE